MARPSKSIKWPILTDITIDVSELTVCNLTTDAQGSTRTNKRGLEGKQAYIILGECEPSSKFISIPKTSDIWTCQINSRGTINSIGSENAGKKVTIVIIK